MEIVQWHQDLGHEEMNAISNMLSFRSSTNFVCTCFPGEICMNKYCLNQDLGQSLVRFVKDTICPICRKVLEHMVPDTKHV